MFTSICKIKLYYFNLHKVISLLRDCFYTAATIPKVKFLLINIFFLIGLEGGGGGVEDTRVRTCTKKNCCHSKSSHFWEQAAAARK